MRSFEFTKMHGLGNNYIYVNMFVENLLEEEIASIAINAANVHTGIGSDGLILICPSEVAPVKMRIFNNDGSEGKNCGNGLRCVAKYVREHRIVTEDTFLIETMSGVVEATVESLEEREAIVTVDMGVPQLATEAIPILVDKKSRVVNEPFSVGETIYHVTAVSMGNPHVIFYLDDINMAPLTTLGPIVERDSRFPEGVNVEFVEVVSDRELHFRVWERGSGITQACGTGACAAVVASVLNNKTTRNEETIVHLAGGDLFITWTNEGTVKMKGPAETICTGTFYYN
ncbi:diaminopimelate epimerase [Sutcliffiella deserti]|uniref:diaminopimelate epimerase n=1 Tax=Sutcliffiella deserti TaxID=2875501 RepID=UPI001CBE1759|nr:diaminopimelate epimerase [Sutcliffiella deserti]